MRRHVRPLLGAILAIPLLTAGCNEAFIQPEVSPFAQVTLTGTTTVPASGSAGTGTATFRRPGRDLKYIAYAVELGGITGADAIHLHRGAAGTNGPILVTLFDGPRSGPVDGLFMDTNFAQSELSPAMTLDELASLIAQGEVYLDVHTAAHPDGELRGQLARP